MMADLAETISTNSLTTFVWHRRRADGTRRPRTVLTRNRLAEEGKEFSVEGYLASCSACELAALALAILSALAEKDLASVAVIQARRDLASFVEDGPCPF